MIKVFLTILVFISIQASGQIVKIMQQQARQLYGTSNASGSGSNTGGNNGGNNGSGEAPTEGGDFVLPGWTYYREVQVNNFGSGIALSDNQIKLELNSANFSFAAANSDGSDLRVVDGSTILPLYIESYNSGAQTAVVWFKASASKGYIKKFALFYGKGDAAAVSSFDNVFTKKIADTYTTNIYHFDEGTGTTSDDAVGSSDATLTGASWVSDVSFASGAAVQTSGTGSSRVTLPVLNTFPKQGSISLKFKPNIAYPTSSAVAIFGKFNSFSYASFLALGIKPNTGALVVSYSKNGAPESYSDDISISWNTSRVYSFTVSWDLLFYYVYMDGVLKLKVSHGGAPASGSAYPLILGADVDPYTGVYYGAFASAVFDELVITDHYMTEAMAYAYATNQKFIPSKIEDKFYAKEGALKIDTDPSWEYTEEVAAEPSMIKEGNTYELYYASGNTTTSYIVRTTSSTIDGTFVRDAHPIIGEGYVGNRKVARTYVLKDKGAGGGKYIFATGVHVFPEHFWKYKYVNGTWTDLGKMLDVSTIPSATTLGNISVTDTAVGGYYYMIAEALISSIWGFHLLRATSLEGSWQYVQSIPSLAIASGRAAGGAVIWYDSGTWHLIYHYAGDYVVNPYGEGNLPTRLAYAKSTDLINWTDKQSVAGLTYAPFTHTDQLADPDVYEGDGKTALTYSVMDNVGTVLGQVRQNIFNGTKKQLVTPFSTSIGSQQTN